MSNLTYKFLQQEIKSSEFDCGVKAINQYVVNSYLATLLQHGYAYQIMYNNIVIGYYMITLNHVKLEDCPDMISEYTSGLSEFLYCAEIKYLAIAKDFQHKKIGTNVLPSIIKSIRDYTLKIPIRLITIDARTDLVQWYKKFGFIEFPKNPEWQDGYTTKMYIDCMIHTKELEEYIESNM